MQAPGRMTNDREAVAMNRKTSARNASQVVDKSLGGAFTGLGYALIFMVAGFGFGSAATAAEATASEPVLTVSATGEVEVVPDRLIVSLGVQTDAASAAEAMGGNARQTAGLIETLRAAGIERKDIATSRLSLYPISNTRKANEPPAIVGYSATNALTVRLASVDMAGPLLDKLVQKGANTIQNITFDISDRDRRLDEARKDAVETAKRRAKVLADAAGVTLGPILSITEGSAPSFMPRPMLGVAKAMPAPVPIEAGAERISTEVTITWRITAGATP